MISVFCLPTLAWPPFIFLLLLFDVFPQSPKPDFFSPQPVTLPLQYVLYDRACACSPSENETYCVRRVRSTLDWGRHNRVIIIELIMKATEQRHDRAWRLSAIAVHSLDRTGNEEEGPSLPRSSTTVLSALPQSFNKKGEERGVQPGGNAMCGQIGPSKLFEKGL